MHLSELLCEHCQGAGLEPRAPSAALCRFCGTLNELAGLVCPDCEWVNADFEAEACARCRRGLRRQCPGCSAANWSGADHCAACGRSLDAVAVLGARLAGDSARRLNALAREAGAIKAREAEASQRRLAQLEAIEARRQALLADAARRRDRQQRGLLLAAVIVALLVMGAAAAVWLAAAWAK